MRVSDIMSSPAVTVGASERLDQVARRMLERGIGSVLVERDGRVVGILTERDFTARPPANPFQKNRAPRLFGRPVAGRGLAPAYGEASTVAARKAMRPLPASLAEDDPVERAVDLMNRHDVVHLAVLAPDGRAVGVVSRHDLLRLVAVTSSRR